MTDNEVRSGGASDLLTHAEQEIDILIAIANRYSAPIDIEKYTAYLAILSKFEKYILPDDPTDVFLDSLERLLYGEPLSPLTDDPGEWISTSPGLHRSKRSRNALSRDGGKTYYLLNDPWDPVKERPIYISRKADGHD